MSLLNITCSKCSKSYPSSLNHDCKKTIKLDSGKPLIFQGVIEYFPEALKEIAKVSEKGAEKYSWGKGWLEVENAQNRYKEDLFRHLTTNEELDEESGLLALGHAAWNALAILELHIKSKEK